MKNQIAKKLRSALSLLLALAMLMAMLPFAMLAAETGETIDFAEAPTEETQEPPEDVTDTGDTSEPYYAPEEDSSFGNDDAVYDGDMTYDDGASDEYYEEDEQAECEEYDEHNEYDEYDEHDDYDEHDEEGERIFIPTDKLIVRFMLNDGSEFPVLYTLTVVNSGETIAAPSAPARGGYEFLAWSMIANDFDFEYIFDFGAAITEDLDLYAQWGPEEVGIMPLDGYFIPYGLELPPGIRIVNVANEAQLRSYFTRNYAAAANAAFNRQVAIRLMNDINVTGSVMQQNHGSNTASFLIYIFSNTPTLDEHFAITRTSGTADTFRMDDGHRLHLHNVLVTSSSGNGGGLRLDDGSDVHLHYGSIIRNVSVNSAAAANNASIWIRSNTAFTADFVMHPGSIVEGNNRGHGIQISNDGRFTMYGGEVRNNSGRGVNHSSSGAVTIHDGIIGYNRSGGINITNSNSVFRMHGGYIEGNTTTGNGAGILFNAVLGVNAFTITGGTIRNNEAAEGGGIFVNSGTTNLPTAAASTRIRIYPETVFYGNVARNGRLINENLGWRNENRIQSAQTSVTGGWLGVHPGTGQVEMRNHLFNNFDINVPNGIPIRPVEFDVIGTAGDDSDITATVNYVARQGAARVPTSWPIESGTLVPVRGPAAAETAQTTQVTFEVTYYPWNTYRPWTPTGIPARSWNERGANVVSASTVFANRNITHVAPNLEANVVHVTIDYRYHNVHFNVYPANSGTLDESLRVLRESRHPDDHTGDRTPNGNPVGLPPAPDASSGWRFYGWEFRGNPISETDIADMYVTGSLTFVAVFKPYADLTIGYVAVGTPVGMTVTVADDLIASNTSATVNNTHTIRIGDHVTLHAGNSPNQTFLGWFTQAAFNALPENNDGNRVVNPADIPTVRYIEFNMLHQNERMLAVWGNQAGVVSQHNTTRIDVSNVP